jgi:hypothetical protein
MSTVYEKEAFVPCVAAPGMFNGEYLVTLRAIDPQNPSGEKLAVQLFVDEREVELFERTGAKGERKGWLKVELAPHETSSTYCTVILPTPAIAFGDSVVVLSGDITRKRDDDSRRPRDP